MAYLNTTTVEEILKSIPNVVKAGFLGAGLFLALATLYLIILEQKKPTPRIGILLTIYSFMFFSFGIIVLGFVADPLILDKIPNITDRKVPPVDGVALIDELKEQNANNNINPTLSVFGKKQYVLLYEDEDLWSFLTDSVDNIVELQVCGAHLQNGIGRILPCIEKILSRGGTVNVLVTNLLDTAAIKYQNQRAKYPIELITYQGLIKNTINDLKIIGEQSQNGKMLVSSIDRPIDERIHSIRTEDNREIIFVKQYSFKNDGGSLYGGLFIYFEKSIQEQSNFYTFYKEKLSRYFAYGTTELIVDKPMIGFNTNSD